MSLHDRVICGDSRDVLKGLPDGCIDAVCTDPPYALSSSRNDTTGFMNLKWDNGQVAHDPAFWAEVLRVARPGAFLLAFGGCRTYHRLVCAIEDAGWEIRDQIVHWLYGSGFPKSKSCLKPSQEPIVLAKAPGPLQPLQIDACRVPTGDSLGGGAERRVAVEGKQEGWARPWMRDPDAVEAHAARVRGNVVHAERLGRWPSNLVLSHVGGPDGCRPAGVRRVPADRRGQGRPRGTFPHSDDAWGNGHLAYTGTETAGDGTETVQDYLCVDGCAVKALDEQAGPRPVSGSARNGRPSTAQPQSIFGGPRPQGTLHDDTGSASRYFPTFPGADPDPEDAVPYFYTPKASRRDRGESNDHSTVKPTALMAWLCKLATPPGGVVLDCFAGSGSTLVACVREGFGFIGIEQDSHYCDIARRRIAHAQQQRHGPLFADADADAEKDA